MNERIQHIAARAAQHVIPGIAIMLVEHYRETGELLDIRTATHSPVKLEGMHGIRFDFPDGVFIEAAYDPETDAMLT